MQSLAILSWLIINNNFICCQAGLVKANMDKLVFFAMKSPDKLDRIGEYLEQRLSRDIARQRYGWVIFAFTVSCLFLKSDNDWRLDSDFLALNLFRFIFILLLNVN